jgi:processing peptidase subunit alpha
MNTLIGSAKGFSSGGPGKGMHSRAVTNLLAKYNYVDGASAVNAHFSDSGLFGLSVEGPGSHSKDLLGRLIDELNALKAPIDEEIDLFQKDADAQVFCMLVYYWPSN